MAVVFPKVSIAMPVFNGGVYFEQALLSALNQTYKNIEIVIVNDGSTDGGATRTVARSYQSQTDKIVYKEQPNGGVAAALNTALECMTGDIFTWLSHDDLFEPHKTELQVSFFQKLTRFGGRLPMLFSDWVLIDAKGQAIHDVTYDHQCLVEAPMRALLTGCINGCTLFIPAILLRQAGGFEPQYKYVQDYRLWNKMLNKNEFFHIPHKLVRYRQHPGQGSHKPEAVMESDPLWIAMMKERSEIEMTQMFGSALRFFRFMADHLQASPYRLAEQYARAQAETCVDSTLVSVVLPFKSGENIEPVLSGLNAQSHANIEIIACEYCAEKTYQLSKKGNVLFIDSKSQHFHAAVNRGLQIAAGSYLIVASTKAHDVHDRIATQLHRVMDAGKLITYSSYFAEGEGSIIVPDEVEFLPSVMAGMHFPLHCMMFHRSLVALGFQMNLCEITSDETVAIAQLAKCGSLVSVRDVLSILRQ